MITESQPISWAWIRAVLVSSSLILGVTSWILSPLEKFAEPSNLARIPSALRWILILPAAFLMGLVAEMLPRLLFSLTEISVNHTLLFRPGFDILVWQGWAPVVFVAAGIQMAPAHKLLTFLVVGGLKIAAAAFNLVQVIQFIDSGGRWTSVDEIVKSPLWWDVVVYVLCLAVLSTLGFFLAKEALNPRSKRHVVRVN